MRNAASSVLRSGIVTLALISSAQSSAEKIEDAKYNIPEVIKSHGDGPNKNFVGIKYPEKTLIVRSVPIETIVQLTYINPQKDAYVQLRCMTPCQFTIPVTFGLSISAEDPVGYVRTSKPVSLQWVSGWTSWKLKPNDITYTYISQ